LDQRTGNGAFRFLNRPLEFSQPSDWSNSMEKDSIWSSVMGFIRLNYDLSDFYDYCD